MAGFRHGSPAAAMAVAVLLALSGCDTSVDSAKSKIRAAVGPGVIFSDVVAYSNSGVTAVCGKIDNPAVLDPPPTRRFIVPGGNLPLTVQALPEAENPANARNFERAWSGTCRGVATPQ